MLENLAETFPKNRYSLVAVRRVVDMFLCNKNRVNFSQIDRIRHFKGRSLNPSKTQNASIRHKFEGENVLSQTNIW